MPVPATHCQPWLLLARSPSTQVVAGSAGRRAATRVQVLDQEAGRRSSAPGCASSPRPSSWRIPASTIGKPVRPSLPGARQRSAARAVVVAPSAAAPARRSRQAESGPVPEHVGVELAPGQLVGERGARPPAPARRRGRPAACAGGSRRTSGRPTAGWCRRSGPVAARRRSRRAARRGTRCQRRARRRSPRRRRQVGHAVELGVGAGRSDVGRRSAQRQRRAARRPGRASRASRQARANGVKTWYGRAVGLGRRGPGPTAYGEPVRTSGDVVAAQRSRTRSSRRRPYGPGVGADVHGGGADLARPAAGSTVAGSPCRTTSAPSYGSCSARRRVAAATRAAAAPAGSQSRGSSTNSGRTEPPDAASRGGEQGGVVGQPQVAAEPEEGVGHR